MKRSPKMTPATLREWINRHCNGNQSEAARQMGMAGQNMRLRLAGQRPITWYDRLVMSALERGVQPWMGRGQDDDPDLTYRDRMIIAALRRGVKPHKP